MHHEQCCPSNQSTYKKIISYITIKISPYDYQISHPPQKKKSVCAKFNCNACNMQVFSRLLLAWDKIWYKAIVVRSMPKNRIVCHFEFVCRMNWIASKMHFVFIHFNEHKPYSRSQSSQSVSQNTYRRESNRLLSAFDSGNEFLHCFLCVKKVVANVSKN